MWLEEVRVCNDGAFVGRLRCGGLVECVLSGAEVEEDEGIVGVALAEAGEEIEGGLVVALSHGVRGFGAERVILLTTLQLGLLRAGAAVAGAGRKLGVGGCDGGEQECGSQDETLSSVTIDTIDTHVPPPPVLLRNSSKQGT